MIVSLIHLLLIASLCAPLGGCATTEPKATGEGIGKLSAQEADSPADLYVALAAEYYRIGQLDAALDRATRAVETDKSNGRAHYVMGIVLQRLGEQGMAEKHFEQAIELEPSNPDIRNAWGAFLCGQGRHAEADEQFAKALANPLFATPALALTNAGLCAMSAGNEAKGEEYLRQALSRDPGFAPALYQMAELNYERRNYKTAHDYIERLLRAAPVAPKSLALAIRVEKALGNRKQATAYTKYLRQSFPDAPELMQL